jgi:hypothetical protein
MARGIGARSGTDQRPAGQAVLSRYFGQRDKSGTRATLRAGFNVMPTVQGICASAGQRDKSGTTSILSRDTPNGTSGTPPLEGCLRCPGVLMAELMAGWPNA